MFFVIITVLSSDEDFCWEDYFNALIPITGTDMLDIDDKLHDVI